MTAAGVSLDKNVVKSAGRVLGILELFSELRSPLTVSQICGCLGIPQSSTSMLLSSMQKLGYLDYIPTNRSYAPTVRVALLGEWLSGALAPEGTLTSAMQHFSDTLGLTVLLGLPRGIFVQLVSVVHPPEGGARSFRVGTLETLEQNALGKMLLAARSDVDVGKLLRRINAEQSNPAGMIDAKATQADIAACRRAKVATAAAKGTKGWSTVAVPLPSPSYQPLSIGAAIPPRDFEERQRDVTAQLRAFAADFSRPKH